MRLTQLKKYVSALLFLVFALGVKSLSAQDDPYLAKAQQWYEEKKYDKVVKLADKKIKEDKKVAVWHYYKGASLYLMSEQPKYKKDKAKLFKDAVKAAIKAKETDEDQSAYENFADVMRQIAAQNNVEAMANFAQKRFAKAVQMYRNSYDLSGDSVSYAYLGMSYWGDRKFNEALPILKQVTVWNYNAFLEGTGDGTYTREPFEYLSSWYLMEDHYSEDSALKYAEMGIAVYPLNRSLLADIRTLLNSQIYKLSRKGAINSDFKNTVNTALKYFPSDSVFLHNQNFYYVTQLMKATQAKPYDSAVSLTSEFYSAKRKLIKAGITNGSDEFLIFDTLKFTFQCLDYFLRTNTSRTAPYFFRTWYAKAYNFNEFDENLAETLLKSPPPDISKRLISMLFEDVLEDYPWNKKIKGYRLDYFNKWMTKPVRKGELPNLLAMNEALIKDFPQDKTLKPALLKNLISSFDTAVKEGQMYVAWAYYYKIQDGFPKGTTDRMRLDIAKADFQTRYASTRIYSTTTSGKTVANTGWDGNSKECIVGMVPDSTTMKVVNRINYFRQNAGVVIPMDFSRRKTQKCQEAAVMFAPKGIFTREPTAATHTCYTKLAAEAAAVGECVLEPNPALCLTIFMDDAKSDELINRRAILNPEATDMGFGCAENNSVFWLLDLAGAQDSAWYTNHFVAWPAPGYSPKMLLFKRWSFSIAANIDDAKVTIKDKSGAMLDVAVSESPAPGMLLRTLIIYPGIDNKKVAPGDYYDVTVGLKNKVSYSYRVTFF